MHMYSVFSNSFLPTVVTPMTLRMMVGGAHSTVKASAMYSAKLRQMMANWLGLMMMVDTQLNMYAEKGPNATMK